MSGMPKSVAGGLFAVCLHHVVATSGRLLLQWSMYRGCAGVVGLDECWSVLLLIQNSCPATCHYMPLDMLPAPWLAP
jgi:hypothetical protein